MLPELTGANYGTLGRLIANAAATKAHLDTLTEQASNGLVSNDYAGLGRNAAVSLDLRPAIAHEQALRNGIDAAAGKLDVTQSALKRISAIASDFFAKATSLNGLAPTQVDGVATAAREALRQVAGLLDTRDGADYVFAGTDTANPPVPNPDGILSSGFTTAITAAVGALSSAGAGPTIAATLATAQSNLPGVSPFSAALSQPPASLVARPQIQTGTGGYVPVGIVASANADVVSTGASTTGSYTRDILRALATLGGLSDAASRTAGFNVLVDDTRTSLGDAITALNTDAGVLGDRQARLQSVSTQLSETSDALQKQVSQVEDVDTAATLSSLTRVQTQLQASYQLIAAQQGLSLTKYLSV